MLQKAHRLPVLLPTASSLDRAEKCAGSMVLEPRIHEEGKWAAMGNAIDRFIRRAREAGADVALLDLPPDDPDLIARCQAIDLRRIPEGAELQVTLAYDPETDRAERIQVTGHRAYPVSDRFYFGTTDCIGIFTPDEIYVDDYKGGVEKRPAFQSMQLRFYALAGARYVGATRADAGNMYVGWNGKWRPDRTRFNAFDLEETRDRLIQIRRSKVEAEAIVADGGTPPLSVGAHCEYCPARRVCPARQEPLRRAAAGALVELAEPILVPAGPVRALSPREKIGPLSGPQRGQLYVALGEIADDCEQARKIIREDSIDQPVPLPSGLELGAGHTTEWKKSEKAKARLAALEAQLRAEGEIVPVKVPRVAQRKPRLLQSKAS